MATLDTMTINEFVCSRGFKLDEVYKDHNIYSKRGHTMGLFEDLIYHIKPNGMVKMYPIRQDSYKSFIRDIESSVRSIEMSILATRG